MKDVANSVAIVIVEGAATAVVHGDGLHSFIHRRDDVRQRPANSSFAEEPHQIIHDLRLCKRGELLQRGLSVGPFCVEVFVLGHLDVKLENGDHCGLVSVGVTIQMLAVLFPRAAVEHVGCHGVDKILDKDVEGLHVVHLLEFLAIAAEYAIVNRGEAVDGVGEARPVRAVVGQHVEPVLHLLSPCGIARAVAGTGEDLVHAVAHKAPLGRSHLRNHIAWVDDVVDVAELLLGGLSFGVVGRHKAARDAVAVGVEVALPDLDVSIQEEGVQIVAALFVVGRVGVYCALNDHAGREVGGRARAGLASNQDLSGPFKPLHTDVVVEKRGRAVGSLLEALVVAGVVKGEVAAPLKLVVAAADTQHNEVVVFAVNIDLAVRRIQADGGLGVLVVVVLGLFVVVHGIAGVFDEERFDVDPVDGHVVTTAVVLDTVTTHLVHERDDVVGAGPVAFVASAVGLSVDGRQRHAAAKGGQVRVVLHGSAREELRVKDKGRLGRAVVVPGEPAHDAAVVGHVRRGRICSKRGLRLASRHKRCGTQSRAAQKVATGDAAGLLDAGVVAWGGKVLLAHGGSFALA